MSPQAVKKIYRFELLTPTFGSGSDSNVVFRGRDTVAGTGVTVFQWTPLDGHLAECGGRLQEVGDIPEAEICSDAASLYLVMPESADPMPIVRRLQEADLFTGSWPGLPDTRLVSSPANEETGLTTTVVAEVVSKSDTETATAAPTRTGMWIVAVLVLVVVISIAVISNNNRLEEERRQAEQRAEQQATALKAERDEAQKKADEAAAQAKAAEAKLARETQEHLIEMPPQGVTGSWWIAMTKDEFSGRQKVLNLSQPSETLSALKSDAEWNAGKMTITALSGSTDGHVMMLMSEMTSPGQEIQTSGEFPTAWIKKKWDEGFRITAITNAGKTWIVVMTKVADMAAQTILGPKTAWPAADIDKVYTGGGEMFITTFTAGEGGFVVIMSSSASKRMKQQSWWVGWDTAKAEQKANDGLRYVQALQYANVWYVVATERPEQTLWRYGDKELPRDEIRRLSGDGYRISWIW